MRCGASGSGTAPAPNRHGRTRTMHRVVPQKTAQDVHFVATMIMMSRTARAPCAVAAPAIQ
jgi:hypothetical protein